MKPSPDIFWIVEKRGMTLTDRSRRLYLSIPYPAAGLWALITNGNYSLEYALDLMATLMSISRQEAMREVLQILSDWREMGLLSEEECG